LKSAFHPGLLGAGIFECFLEGLRPAKDILDLRINFANFFALWDGTWADAYCAAHGAIASMAAMPAIFENISLPLRVPDPEQE